MALERRLDLGSLLTRAEAAAPVGAADAMAAAMREMLGARGVSFLIADFSGRSLSRLGHIDASGEAGARTEETSERVRLDGSPYGDALAEQRPVVLQEADGTRVIAPVTSRGHPCPFRLRDGRAEEITLAAQQPSALSPARAGTPRRSRRKRATACCS